jgi:8-oxo-dGTP diphosphatase
VSRDRSLQSIEVVAGVVQRGDRRVLVAERPSGSALAGYLEFPGGKIEAGETPTAALAREFSEELGTAVLEAQPLIRFEYAYPEYRVRLRVYRVTRWHGEPHGREGQRLAWAGTAELRRLRLLPANRPVVTALELPETLLVTPEPPPEGDEAFLHTLDSVLQGPLPGGAIVRIRDSDVAARLVPAIARCAAGSNRPLILNTRNAAVLPAGFAGLHLSAAALVKLRTRPAVGGWVGASVHGVAEAAHAAAVGLDYVVVGSVRETPSHPGVTPLGWEGFARIAAAAGLPAYAIGGLGPADVAAAQENWGQGIAAVRAFWPG